MKYDVAAKFDVVIIGSGISGLLCAIDLARNGKSVFIGTKEAVTESSSLYAQGGMAVPLADIDSVDQHLEDTVKAGTELCDLDVARKIIEYSKEAFERLVNFGVQFDLNKDNTFHQTKEACHSFPRVVHAGGDASGRYITKTLIDNACREPNISISQGTVAVKIVNNQAGGVGGVLFEDVARHRYIVECDNVIIATGGVGRLYKYTTNPEVSTGDGIIMAYDAGATLQDLEMIQFHPTACLINREPFLITEAIRGEGAKLKNINGELFADKYHPDGELAPRDVLSRAILCELKETNSDYVYLTLENFEEEYFKNRFPTIYQYCITNKIDLFGKGIPVAPAAHYIIGGIKTDENGQTDVPGLWAVGECSSTGFHGANRLASNSLLECIAVPQFLVKKLLSEPIDNSPVDLTIEKVDMNQKDLDSVISELCQRNLVHLGPIRNGLSLKTHKEWLKSMIERFKAAELSSNQKTQELKNMLRLSLLICDSAIARTNSIGVHFRDDYPEMPREFNNLTVSNSPSKKTQLTN